MNPYPPGSHGPFAHRPIVWGRHGMVGAGTQLTAQAGMRVLHGGGNVVDAAVASALAAGVLEPTAHYTLGGEVAMLCYEAATGKVRSVVGQGWSSQAATIELYKDNWGEIPPGVHSTTVPGVISALLTMLAEYGTMSFTRVATDACSLAREGFPAYQLFCRALSTPERVANVRNHPDSARVFHPDGEPPTLGALFKQPDLARTLSLMAQAEESELKRGSSRAAGIQAARNVFYKGEIGEKMVTALRDLGGLYEMEDFADYTSPLEEPISTTYRGYEIFTNRTWTQGIVLLQALKILEGYDIAALGHNSPEAIHHQVEALKLAFADRERYAGDPAHVDVPVDGLLSTEYAAARREVLDEETAQGNYPPGDPIGVRGALPHEPSGSVSSSPNSRHEQEGTTHLATADEQGNLVAATPSTYAGLLQGMILGDTGILINCRGCYFWLDPDNPNALAPRKRPRTTPCTFLVLKDGQPFMTLGTPGGDSQTQSCLQVFNNLIDFGLDVQDAVAAPRFCSHSFPQSPWPHAMAPNRLAVEGRISREVIDRLQDRGHVVEDVGPWGITNGFAPIVVDPDSAAYRGGADPRRESFMLGW